MAHNHSITENTGQIIGIAAIAAGVGALTALLFTPRSGEQVRSGLKRRGMHFKDDMQHRMHRSHDAIDDIANTTANHLTDTMSDAKTRAVSTTSKIKGDAKHTTRRIKSDAKNITKDSKDEIDEIRRNGER